MKWIFNVDIFFSINVCDKFTKNSVNIYMHHDISTAPLIDVNKEKVLSKRLKNYDFIFIPDKKSFLMFKNLFIENSIDKNQKVPKIFCVGYFKLDYLIERFTNHKNLEKFIVIAPSDFRHIDELSIFHNIKDIINILLDKTELKIVFRPYPRDRGSSKVLEIKEKFNKNKNFILDLSDDYFEIYSNSICMITDISGTAFTFAYMTGKPVIFFSNMENSLKRLGYLKLEYFNDREKIGLIARNPEEVLETVNQLKYTQDKIKITNKILLNKIDYLGNSKKRIKTLLDEIIAKNYKDINEEIN